MLLIKKDVLLRGLDGSNPLGFLASIGAMVEVSRTEGIDVRMGWVEEDTWHPILSISPASQADRLPEMLHDRLKVKDVDDLSKQEEARLKKEFDAAKKKTRSTSERNR